MDEQNGKPKRTFTEEIEVMGNQLIEQVRDLLKQGNVRQLRIKTSGGDIVLETPLTFGVVAGGAVALAAPWLAILGAIAAFVTHVKIEVVREVADSVDAKTASPADAPVAEPAAKSKTGAKSKASAAGKAKSAPRIKSAKKAKS